mmetsp:Transcript_67042/g.135156  ORF Transcript_67042/g.135156 Transcript_67042/m.135156 type:complete len:235 (+) Transcript_67042:164-868(+)
MPQIVAESLEEHEFESMRTKPSDAHAPKKKDDEKRRRHGWHAHVHEVGYDMTREHGDTWAHEINSWMHDPTTEIVLHILLFVDIILLAMSMQVEVYYLESKVDDLEHSCEHHECPSHHGELEKMGNEAYEHAEEGLVYASVAILCVFLLHSVMLVVANGLKYFKNPLSVLDLTVVLISLVFELADHENVSVGILVLVRAWRFVRIGHGIHELEQGGEKEKKEKDTAPASGPVGG